MKVYFEKRIQGGFFSAIIILAGLGICFYSNNQKSIQTNRMVCHTNEVLYPIDTKYSNKLFGVFQLLHKIRDFERTALVHRIVTRYGGKIGADANVNEGTTFSFFISLQQD